MVGFGSFKLCLGLVYGVCLGFIYGWFSVYLGLV